MNSAHIHLLLNHLPVIGTIFGLLLLLWAMLRKSDELQRVSLGIFVLVALVAVPVYLTGEPAEEVVEHLPGVAGSFIEQHEEAGLLALLGAAFTGLASLAGLLVRRRTEKLPGLISTAVLALALATSGLMGWTGNLGGQIRHTEIRSNAGTVDQTPSAPATPKQEEPEKH